MKIAIIAIGKMKAGPEKEIMASYLKRVPWEIQIKELEEKKSLSGEALKAAEAKLLLGAAAKSGRQIALDERGQDIPSEVFAGKIREFQADGPITFFIGGAAGLADEIRSKSSLILSFGKLTWPHMLARAMLAEQIYRAYAINSGHPYHK